MGGGPGRERRAGKVCDGEIGSGGRDRRKVGAAPSLDLRSQIHDPQRITFSGTYYIPVVPDVLQNPRLGVLQSPSERITKPLYAYGPLLDSYFKLVAILICACS